MSSALAYDRLGPADGPPVMLLHGWPGDRRDWSGVAERLAADHDVVVPDLAGFGDSLTVAKTLPDDVGLDAQRAFVAELMDDLGRPPAVVGGYDVGGRVAQAVARERPDLVRALVLAPPLPGAGERLLEPGPIAEFWYQAFQDLDLAERLIDGHPDAVRAYLEHFWTHWSGPAFAPPTEHRDRLADAYARPGAFVASISWYRSGSGTIRQAQAESPPDTRIAAPTTVLWPQHDPLFPPDWGDRVDEWFADAAVTTIDCGHFAPLERPEAFADAIRRRTA